MTEISLLKTKPTMSLARIDEVFRLHRAKSGLFKDYKSGPVTYVGNGFANCGVTGFVTPRPKDTVFEFMGIAVSAFCEATVHVPPFIGCGRAGNGLTILEPKEKMTAGQLAFIAAYINQHVRWRFNWYRQTTAERLRPLLVPDAPPALDYKVAAALPKVEPVTLPAWKVKTAEFVLGDLYDLRAGDFHSLGELLPGETPVVSCGDTRNGVAGYYAVTDPTYSHRLTVAFNGSTLTSKYHPYTFAAKDDVAVCIPRHPYSLPVELYIQATLNRERWRYSYYRKCYMEKLRRFCIPLPAKRGKLDEKSMEAMVTSSPYWSALEAIAGGKGDAQPPLPL